MKPFHWQLENPVQAILFDCDGTLSTLEGIDELAKANGVGPAVSELTAQAMGCSGINANLYQRRLDLVQPKAHQLETLGEAYFNHQMADAAAVISTFQRLKKNVYVVSAGLYPAVKRFGERLNILPENIFAVGIQFDAAGNFLTYDKNSPLIENNGKRKIVNLLKVRHPEIIHIGDGLNDYVTHDLVRRFIGFGGAYYREHLAKQCEYYIRTASLAPLLPLSLTEAESTQLTPEETSVYRKGMLSLTKADTHSAT